MAKIVNKMATSISGVVAIDGSKINIEIEDAETVNLADIIDNYNGKEVKIAINTIEEIL